MLSYLNKHKYAITCATIIPGLIVGCLFGTVSGVCAALCVLVALISYAVYLVRKADFTLRNHPIHGLVRLALHWIYRRYLVQYFVQT